MKHIPTSLVTAVAIAFASNGAWAQSTQPVHFVGPALGITVSAMQNKTDYESATPSINGKSSQANDSDASLMGSWGFALSPDWVGTVGISYSLKSVDAGSFTYTAGGTQTVTTKIKDHFSLSFAPGYRVGPNALVYGKLAYHQIKSEYTDTFMGPGSTSHSGTGVGIGAAFALDRNIELRAEYETVAYGSVNTTYTTAKPSHSGLTIGLLYKF